MIAPHWPDTTFGQDVSAALRAIDSDILFLRDRDEMIPSALLSALFRRGFPAFVCNTAVAIFGGGRVFAVQFGECLVVLGSPFPGGLDEWANDDEPEQVPA